VESGESLRKFCGEGSFEFKRTEMDGVVVEVMERPSELGKKSFAADFED
jgi:hypothetical protein